MDETLEHYRALAGSYDEMWLYGDAFVEELAKKIFHALDLRAADALVDIGCGTGIYTDAVRRAAGLTTAVTCVDPSAEMLSRLPIDSGLLPVQADAISFLEGDVSGDKFLMKEAVHHVHDKRRLFTAIASTLTSHAVFLILLLPPTIEYPLFSAALRRFEELQPHYSDLVNLASECGLRAEAWTESVPLRIEKTRYLRMVAGRYMSLLSTFSDDELSAGLAEIDRRYPDGPIEFDDSFVFLRLAQGA